MKTRYSVKELMDDFEKQWNRTPEKEKKEFIQALERDHAFVTKDYSKLDPETRKKYEQWDREREERSRLQAEREIVESKKIKVNQKRTKSKEVQI